MFGFSFQKYCLIDKKLVFCASSSFPTAFLLVKEDIILVQMLVSFLSENTGQEFPE